MFKIIKQKPPTTHSNSYVFVLQGTAINLCRMCSKNNFNLLQQENLENENRKTDNKRGHSTKINTGLGLPISQPMHTNKRRQK